MAKKLSSTKRFGTRYGRRVKHKLAKIEEETKKRQMCPYCRAYAVKRLVVGIWECRKCSSKFTGKAYTIGNRAAITEKKVEAVSEEPAENQSFTEEDSKPTKEVTE